MRAPVASLLLLTLPSAACYNYLPRPSAELSPAMYVEVGLTSDGSDSLIQYLGPNIVSVRGRFQAVTDRGLSLAVWSVRNRRGDVYGWRGETVQLPVAFVGAVQERQAARFKTALLGGVFIASFFIAARAFGPSASGGSAAGGGSGSGRQ